MSVVYNYESNSYKIFSENLASKLANYIAISEGYILEELEYSILSDLKLLEINRKFLNHDYLTDVITFDESFLKRIKGKICVSFERVQDNAVSLKEDMELEMYRVLMHGVLHLVGYKDFTEEEKKLMHKKEDEYLEQLKSFQ